MFIYKSRRELLKYLGQLDGLVQLNEIALRYFQKQNPEKKDLIDAIKVGSIEIKVNVSYIEWPNFFDRFYKELISSIYSSFEKFYDLYWSELQVLFPDQYQEKDQIDKNKLTRLLKYYLIIVKKRPNISDNIINIFRYYHSLRNDTVHPERANTKKTKELLEKLDLEKTKLEFNFSPAGINSVSFDDYLLFSKVTKKICIELSDKITPTTENLIHLIPKKFTADKFNGERKITEFFRREYGLDKKECKEIIEYLKAR
jgi:hypothetical protein